MYIGTTPTYVIRVNTANKLSEMKKIQLTFSSSLRSIVIEKDRMNIDDENSTLTVTLTREETLKFVPGIIRVQLMVVDASDSISAGNIVQINVEETLNGGAMYE